MFEDPELLAGFLDESSENLSIIEPDLLELEKNGDATDGEIINRIFRAIHSIKGGAGFFGLENVGRLSHEMESLLAQLRDRKIPVTQTLMDLLFEGFDVVKDLFSDLATSDNKDIGEIVQRVIRQRETGSSGSADTAPKAKPAAAPTAPPASTHSPGVSKKQLADLIESGRYVYHVSLTSDWPPDGEAWVKEIERLGKIVAAVDATGNPVDPAAAVQGKQQVGIYYSTVLDPDLISGGLLVAQESIEQVTFATLDTMPDEPQPAVAPAAALAPQAPVANATVPAEESPQEPSESAALADLRKRKMTDEKLRVSVNLLNDLMDLAGELVLARNQLGEVVRTTGSVAQPLQHSMQNVSWVTSEIQEKIMGLRMQPLSVLFSKFPRTVRDLSKQTGKQIVLEMKGEEVELDKTIVELLVDPMTHLVRNAVDHGIEMPDRRQQAGKQPQGTIRFEAYQEGGQVHIDIIDDGNGIDPVKIGAKALEKGLVTKEALAQMSEREKLRIIFMPGFSTVETVSSLSGRGVGMDVVLKNIEVLSGTVEIESEVGKGTRFGLILPLTLAIVKGLVFRVSGRRFIVPEVNIDELVRLRLNELKNKVNMVQGVKVLRLREQLLPVLDLQGLLQLDEMEVAATEKEKPSSGEHRATAQFVIVRFGTSLYAMQVDSVDTVDEIVIKPLPSFFQKMPFYSGATVLGDGSVALILDPAGMAEAVGVREFEDTKAVEQRKAETEEEKLQETVSLLLFDNGTSERFALPLQLISRIELIDQSAIEWINDNPYFQYRDEKLRLILLHDLLPVARPDKPLEGRIGVLIPKTARHPSGIVFRNIIDTIESTIELDTDSITAPGLFGSSVLEGRITLMPNMFEIFDLVFPDESERDGAERNVHFPGGKLPQVLVVDDTPFFRMMEKKYLESAGFRVKLAVNGAEALEMLEREEFDAVVLDIVMPGMSGYDVVREIRKRDKLAALPVIAVTSLEDVGSRTLGEEAGFDDWEEKLNKERLVAKVLHLLKVNAGNEDE